MECRKIRTMTSFSHFFYGSLIATFCFGILFSNISHAMDPKTCALAKSKVRSKCNHNNISPIFNFANANSLEAQSFSDASDANYNDGHYTSHNKATAQCLQAAKSCLSDCGYAGDSIKMSSSQNFLFSLGSQSKPINVTPLVKACLSSLKTFAKFNTQEFNKHKMSGPSNSCDSFSIKNMKNKQAQPKGFQFMKNCGALTQFAKTSIKGKCPEKTIIAKSGECIPFDPKPEDLCDDGLIAAGKCKKSKYILESATTEVKDCNPSTEVSDGKGGCKAKPSIVKKSGSRCEKNEALDDNGECESTVSTPTKPSSPKPLASRCGKNEALDDNGKCESTVSTPTKPPVKDPSKLSKGDCIGPTVFLNGKCESISGCSRPQINTLTGKLICSDPQSPDDDAQKKCEGLNAANPGSHKIEGNQCVVASNIDRSRECDKEGKIFDALTNRCENDSNTNGDPSGAPNGNPNNITKDDLNNLERAMNKASANLGGGGSGGGGSSGGGLGGGFSGGDSGGDSLQAGNIEGDESYQPNGSFNPHDGAGDARPITPLSRFKTPLVGVPPSVRNAEAGGAPSKGRAGNHGGSAGNRNSKSARSKPKGSRGKSSLWGTVQKMASGFFGGGNAPPSNNYKASTTAQKRRNYPNGRGGTIEVNGLGRAELDQLNNNFHANMPNSGQLSVGQSITNTSFINALYSEYRNNMLNRYGCEPPLTSCTNSPRKSASSKRVPNSVKKKKRNRKKKRKKRSKKRK